MKSVRAALIILLFVAGFFGVFACANQYGEKSVAKKENGCKVLKLKDSARTSGQIAFLPLGVYMSALDYEDGILSVLISNQSGYTMTYGGEYYLQKKDGDKWIDLPLPENFIFPEGAKSIKDLDDNIEKYDLNIFGGLEAGQYKIKKMDFETTFVLTEM